MSLLKPTLESPAVAIPFKVRLEPYLVESICELSRLVRDKGSQNSDVSGLLFGREEAGARTVEALKTFSEAGPHSELARRERWEKAYKTALEDSKTDPELSAFDVVGWFSFRIGSGLLSSDVVFHNQHFRKPEDLALIIWREGPSQITVEVYSKAEGDSLTSDDYRWGSIRLSADIRHMREPIDLAMRVKLSDDSYLRTYDAGEPPSQLEVLRRKAEAASERLLGFLYRRKEETYTEKVRGYIGDGRLPNRPLGINEPVATDPQNYFNPYSDVARRKTTLGLSDASPLPAAAWPGAAAGTAFATAPAKSPEMRSDLHLNEGNAAPPSATPPLSILDLSAIGRAPRTGRAPSNEIGGLPMLLRPPVVKKTFPWALVAVIFVVCSGLAFGVLAMGGLQTDGGRIGQVFHSMFPGGDLDLKVKNEDDRLRLSWNLRNHAVASASDATLQIFDGHQHRDVHLDGRQVADGSVLYRPLTNDVTFRLEVRGDQGAASGSVRILDSLAGRQEVLDVSAPTTPAPQQTAAAIPSADPALQPPDNSASSSPQPGSEANPSLLRDGASMAATPAVTNPAAAPPPVTDAGATAAPPLTIDTRAPVTQPKLRPSRYETPPTVAAQPQPGAATINGWDASTPKARRTKPLSLAQAPVFSTIQTQPSAAGYVPPRPLMQVMPNTRAIPNGTIQARTRVEVQVDVDPSGRVSNARVISSGINDQISNSALAAARQWTFDPASNNGQRVSSVHTIVFEFRPEQR